MAISVNSFEKAVQSRASDLSGLSSSDVMELCRMFSALEREDKTSALEFCLEKNYAGLYRVLCGGTAVAPLHLSSFTNGVQAANDRAYGIDVQEQFNLRDAFSRLGSKDQGLALEFLLKNDYADVLTTVNREADASVGVSFSAFKLGVEAADDGCLSATETDALRDAFRRLSPQDQSRAVEYLRTQNYPDLCRVVGSAA